MTRLPAALLLAIASSLSTPLQALVQPDCSSLELWAAGFGSADSLSLAPKVVLPGQFTDTRTLPLFGSTVTEWAATDFTAVRKMLNDCRKPATKRGDKAAADHLYKAMKSVGDAMRPMDLVRQFRIRSAQSVDNMVNYHRVPELPQVLALGERALAGEDVESELNSISIGRSFLQHVRVLRQSHDYLSPGEVDPLMTKLAAAQQTVAAERTAVDEEFSALKEALEAVPMTEAGARELDRLNQSPVLGKVSREQALAFQSDVMRKRQATAYAIRQQASRQAATEAARPVDLVARLNSLFTGDAVGDISLRGIRPGLAYTEARHRMERDWRFGTGAGGDLVFKQYYPNNRDLEAYKQQERRDGGSFEFETFQDRVGKLVFTEHYTGALDGRAIRSWLIERFGKPDTEQAMPTALTWNWEADGTHLQVLASNQAMDPMRAMRGFRSALLVTLWSQDFTDFLAAARERCQQLMNKPQSELSVQDKMDVLQGCRQ